MKQSPLMSLVESCGGTAVGFVLALIAQAIFWPLLGVPITASQNLVSVGIMTVLSVLRGYYWRRFMEFLHVRHPISPFMLAVIAERRRQIEVEGWTVEHDDQHAPGELARAGGAYACYAHWHLSDAADRSLLKSCPPEGLWTWSREWWKPVGFRRDLVKGCALIVAEGEKFDRPAKRRRNVRAETAEAA